MSSLRKAARHTLTRLTYKMEPNFKKLGILVFIVVGYAYVGIHYMFLLKVDKMVADAPPENDVVLRIIVIAYNRPKSLTQCLQHIAGMDTDGDRILVDIFIDKNKNKNLSKNQTEFSSDGHHIGTVTVAKAFKFKDNPVTVHLHPQHVGIYGQWIDTWSPTPDTKELALFVEDDLDLSPHFWKWLKVGYHKYRNDSDVMGFSLRGNPIVAGPLTGQWLSGTRIHNAFMYKLLGSHGFAPLPHVWHDFQQWFRKVVTMKDFKPYVPGIQQTSWYKDFEKRGNKFSMWTMWVIHYSWINKKFIVYPNISKYYKKPKDTGGELIVNRGERGLHVHSKRGYTRADQALLKVWHKDLAKFPKCISKYDWTGQELDTY